jgi:tripartite-type tricarboxylate transporter receptor subunit TctC
MARDRKEVPVATRLACGSLRIAVVAFVLLYGVCFAHSSDEIYPRRCVTLVVPVAAGGAMDLIARKICDRLGQRLGQRFTVENRPGAGGGIGAASVARAVPDGYTLLMGNIGPNAINVTLYKKLPYDNEKDFSPIGLAAKLPHLLVANAKVPVASVKELIDLAKREPGSLIFATSGIGQSIHIAAELFRRKANVDIRLVPYPGGAPAMRDVAAGHVSLTFDPVGTALPLVLDGTTRTLDHSQEDASGVLERRRFSSAAHFDRVASSICRG